ncbi:hypothetical protein ABZV67_40450 [Streptomyces sp. NPDC005065]|uniref:hypothetical protein n=1 Tax=Streptomyces sp. NPDC005065 TaxID=3154461 RepID=UPI0033B7467E
MAHPVLRRVVVRSASEPHGSVQALATAGRCGSSDRTRPRTTHTIQARTSSKTEREVA